MKKFIIALAMLMTTAASAQNNETCESCGCPDNFPVYVPTHDSCFLVYESVLFLRPNTENLGFRTADFKPAFNLEFCYTFPCSGINTQLSWTHFYSKQNLGHCYSERIHDKFHYDAVNWNGGVRMNVGPYVALRPHAGLGFVRIREDITQKSSHYTGVGPRFGMDCACKIYDHLNLVGSFATAIFFGCSKARHHFYDNIEWNDRGSSNRVVPSLEGSIGLNYDNCLCGYEFTIEGGYMGVIYINSLRHYTSSSWGYGTGQSDFSLDGPYAKLNVRF